jgi:hypothetical protein
VGLIERPDAIPAITVIWTAKGSEGTRLLTASSLDGGLSFSDAVAIPGTESAGNRGWQSMATGPRGRVATAWLDHRRLATQESAMAAHHGATHAHTDHSDSVAMAQLSHVYFSTLDAGATPHSVTGGVCYCCKTAMAYGSQGSIFLAWRHVYPGNLRDIAFAVSRDGGLTFSQPVRVSEDKWSIDGCPDDGPAVAVDARDRVHIVWPTVISDEGEPIKGLFYSVSVDGTTFSPRVRIPTRGHASHPQVVIRDEAPVVIWDESAPGRRGIAMAVGSTSEGRTTFSRQLIPGTEAGVYPALATTTEGVLAAWTSDGSAIHLRKVF